jgi:hypothetical protein
MDALKNVDLMLMSGIARQPVDASPDGKIYTLCRIDDSLPAHFDVCCSANG